MSTEYYSINSTAAPLDRPIIGRHQKKLVLLLLSFIFPLLCPNLDLLLRTVDHNILESLMDPFPSKRGSLMIANIVLLGVEEDLIGGNLHIQVALAADQVHVVSGNVEIYQLLDPVIQVLEGFAIGQGKA